jgi:hypothetical protein
MIMPENPDHLKKQISPEKDSAPEMNLPALKLPRISGLLGIRLDPTANKKAPFYRKRKVTGNMAAVSPHRRHRITVRHFRGFL